MAIPAAPTALTVQENVHLRVNGPNGAFVFSGQTRGTGDLRRTDGEPQEPAGAAAIHSRSLNSSPCIVTITPPCLSSRRASQLRHGFVLVVHGSREHVKGASTTPSRPWNRGCSPGREYKKLRCRCPLAMSHRAWVREPYGYPSPRQRPLFRVQAMHGTASGKRLGRHMLRFPCIQRFNQPLLPALVQEESTLLSTLCVATARLKYLMRPSPSTPFCVQSPNVQQTR